LAKVFNDNEPFDFLEEEDDGGVRLSTTAFAIQRFDSLKEFKLPMKSAGM
jgi:hypothetical protein